MNSHLLQYLGAGYAPKINPNAGGISLNDQGEWTNQLGQVVSSEQAFDPKANDNLYQDPSFGMRLFNPALAGQINQQNAQYQIAPALAKQELGFAEDKMRGLHSTGNDIFAQDFAKVRPFLGQQFNDPNMSSEQGGIMLGGNLQPSNVSRQAGDLAGIQMNQPQLDASNEFQLGQNKSRQLVTEGLLEVPESNANRIDVGNRAAVAQDQSYLNRLPMIELINEYGDLNLLRQNKDLAPLQQDLSLSQTQGGIAAQPFLNSANLDEAKLRSAYGTQDIDNIGSMLSTRSNNLDKASIESQILGNYNPSGASFSRLNPDGTISTGFNNNTLGMEEKIKMAAMQKYLGTGSPMTGGMKITTPPKGVVNNTPSAYRNPVSTGAPPMTQSAPTATQAARQVEATATPKQTDRPIVGVAHPSIYDRPVMPTRADSMRQQQMQQSQAQVQNRIQELTSLLKGGIKTGRGEKGLRSQAEYQAAYEELQSLTQQ